LLLANAAGALATLLHLNPTTPEEDAQWRERLQPAFGDRLRLTRWRIAEGDRSTEGAAPAPQDGVTHAYALCRNLALTRSRADAASRIVRRRS
jgi:hypothetical protein